MQGVIRGCEHGPKHVNVGFLKDLLVSMRTFRRHSGEREKVGRHSGDTMKDLTGAPGREEGRGAAW